MIEQKLAEKAYENLSTADKLAVRQAAEKLYKHVRENTSEPLQNFTYNSALQVVAQIGMVLNKVEQGKGNDLRE